jgi:Arc/MetJ-type ribon-helix-helix transcriptional regulator
MAKKDMKGALGASLKAEEQAVKSRFEKAEAALGKKDGLPEQRQRNEVERVIRDSFTIPNDEYELISKIKRRCMKAGIGANKSEVLRAGLAALNAMPEKELARLFEKLPRVKPGRPSSYAAALKAKVER